MPNELLILLTFNILILTQKRKLMNFLNIERPLQDHPKT